MYMSHIHICIIHQQPGVTYFDLKMKQSNEKIRNKYTYFKSFYNYPKMHSNI